MAKKITLKHMQENGKLATRQTARAYTHVLLLKQNNATRAAALESGRAVRVAKAIKTARIYFEQCTVEIAAGVGGQVPYWPGQGGCDGSGRTHEQPEWQYKLACTAMEERKDLTGYVQHAIKNCNADVDADIAACNRRSEDWIVVSWHTRADLAKPQYQVEGDLFKVEAINNGVRDLAPTLADYAALLEGKACELDGAPLLKRVDTYAHADGWHVRGFAEKQWLSTTCTKCAYEWSLNKLGIPRPFGGLKQEAKR